MVLPPRFIFAVVKVISHERCPVHRAMDPLFGPQLRGLVPAAVSRCGPRKFFCLGSYFCDFDHGSNSIHFSTTSSVLILVVVWAFFGHLMLLALWSPLVLRPILYWGSFFWACGTALATFPATKPHHTVFVPSGDSLLLGPHLLCRGCFDHCVSCKQQWGLLQEGRPTK